MSARRKDRACSSGGSGCNALELSDLIDLLIVRRAGVADRPTSSDSSIACGGGGDGERENLTSPGGVIIASLLMVRRAAVAGRPCGITAGRFTCSAGGAGGGECFIASLLMALRATVGDVEPESLILPGYFIIASLLKAHRAGVAGL